MLSNRGPRRTIVRIGSAVGFSFLFSLSMGVFLPPLSYAQSRDLVVSPVSPGSRVTVAGHHPLWASVQNDVGAVPADLSMQLVFVLAGSPEQQLAFDQFLAAQQNPSSPDYHHWLTPVETGERFGATQHDIDAITNWLQSQNLRVDSVANSRVRIRFSGTALAVANAFGSEMHYFQVDSERRMSIAAEPQIPAALSGIIQSIGGLYTVKIVPAHGMGTARVPVRSMDGTSGGVAPDFTTSTGAHYIFPADFAKIYDANVGNITGSGETIAIIGISRVYPTDITSFQTLSGLTPQAPNEIIPPNGTDPGSPETSPPMSGSASPGQSEATLDVTRAASIAPGATIDLVVSANGISIPAEYVVDSVPVFAQIMSISFSACEAPPPNGSSEVNFWDSLFRQAAAEGISVFVASGDAGAAGCDAIFKTPPATQSLSINSICASSFATCVGGTEFADVSTPSQYWSSTNNSTESALGYIPEGGWNEPGTSSTPIVAASGGGVSQYIPTPSWQTGTGVSGTQGRYTPDVAFSASSHDGYFACFAAGGGSCVQSGGSFTFVFFAGTSASAPDMAGISALLNQNYGAQGNLNQNLYRLAAIPAFAVFHDVNVTSSGVSGCTLTLPSMCNNSTPGPTSQTGGLSGYQVGAGYDEVTGLGSIDIANLLANWVSAGTTTTIISSLNPSTLGAPVTFTAAVTTVASATPTGTVTFFDGTTSIGTGSLSSSAMATLTSQFSNAGSHSITATYEGNSTFTASTSAVLTQVVNLDPTTTVEVPPLLKAAVGGQSLTFQVTVTSTSSGTPTGTLTIRDNGAPVGTGTLNSSGTVNVTTTSLGVGTHSITANYGGDSTFAASTSTATNIMLSLVAFGVPPPPTSLTVTVGNTITIPLTIYQASGSNLSFMLNCAGLPAKTSCLFNPNPVTPGTLPNGTLIQLTFGTASSRLPASPSDRFPFPWEMFVFSAVSAGLLAEGMIQSRRAPRLRLACGMRLVICALGALLAGCAGSNTSSGPVYSGTPKGPSTFTVTATSGATTASSPIVVNVQ